MDTRCYAMYIRCQQKARPLDATCVMTQSQYSELRMDMSGRLIPTLWLNTAYELTKR